MFLTKRHSTPSKYHQSLQNHSMLTLLQLAHASAGQTVFVHGGTGAVGIACIQFCRAYGMKVIASGGTAQGLELMKSVGVHHGLLPVNTAHVIQLVFHQLSITTPPDILRLLFQQRDILESTSSLKWRLTSIFKRTLKFVLLVLLASISIFYEDHRSSRCHRRDWRSRSFAA